ncbi:MAG TPA: TetR family transcriptional regulator [Phototrophicaceae bacterium]|jgi:TetR/AcrR family acrAB operon transcriptional repressor|nr:TetR family transcriptional regulator [Phototrophicaceae bacterium]
MKRTKEETEVTRQALLKAALNVFSHQGYSDTRLEDIAEEAGVTRGAIYHHFGSKSNLYNVLVTEASQQLSRVIMQALAEGTVLERLGRMFVDSLVFAAEDEHQRAISELVILKTALSPEIESGYELKRAGNHAVVAMLADLVRQGQAMGEIRQDLDARTAVIGLLGLQNGLLMMWLLDPTLFSIKDRAAELAEIYLRGLQTL